jgi:hypothetical protein
MFQIFCELYRTEDMPSRWDFGNNFEVYAPGNNVMIIAVTAETGVVPGFFFI